MLSSSSLSLLEQTCPRALDHMEDGAPRDSSVFDVGTAAHAVMEEIQRESVRLGGVPLTDEQRTLVSSRTVSAHRLGIVTVAAPIPPQRQVAVHGLQVVEGVSEGLTIHTLSAFSSLLCH